MSIFPFIPVSIKPPNLIFCCSYLGSELCCELWHSSGQLLFWFHILFGSVFTNLTNKILNVLKLRLNEFMFVEVHVLIEHDLF